MAARALFFGLAALALVPGVPTWAALVAGIVFGLTIPHPFAAQTKRVTTWLLQASIVGLGAAMSLDTVLRVGARGVSQTFITITLTVFTSLALARLFSLERVTSLLIGVGTAICGGSAIAAVSPVIGAKPHQTSVALAVVFLLNAVGLAAFPALGHAFELDPASFGLWSALAIHDTSSVVGASMQFGDEALRIGTTVKLARALWIVPLTLVIGRFVKSPEPNQPAKRPWFILGFLAMAALVTWVPALHDVGTQLAAIARQVLVATLFLIGTGITREALRTTGLKPVLLGVMLWLAVSIASLTAIRLGWLTS